MKFLDFVSVRLAFWLVFGILIGYYWEPNSLWAGMVLLLALGVLGYFRLHAREVKVPVFGITLAIAMTALGMFTVGLTHPENCPDHFSKTTELGKHQLQLKIREVLKPNDYSDRYIVNVLSVAGTEATGKCILSIPRIADGKALLVDNEIFVYSKPAPVPPPLNPNQFDYREYLKKQGIHHEIRVSRSGYVLINGASKTLLGRAVNFRQALIAKLREHDFGEAQLGVIQALLLGQRNDIPEDTYTDYKNAGAVHILAVSGLHIGILLLLFQLLLRPLERLPKGKALKLGVIVLLLWVYAFIAGLSPSVVRAVTMFSFIAYALYLNRPTNTFNIVTLSLVFILLIHPLFLFQVGFQMSYGAVFAIVWIYPKLQDFWNPENYIVRKAWQLLSVSVAAQLGVLPISLFYFHQFPALFFVSNLLVVPFLGIILGFGLLVVALAYFEVLPDMVVYAYSKVIGGMNTAVAWVGQQETFVFKDIPFDAIQLVLTYLVIFGLVFTLTKSTFRNLVFLLSTTIAFIGHSLYVNLYTNQKERVLLTHQNRNSILFHQNGKTLHVLATDTSRTQRLVTAYTIAHRIETVKYNKLQNSYALRTKQLIRVDSAAVLPQAVQQPDYLLLTQSPKINLARIIDSIAPKMILADGSNYASDAKRWQNTCEEKQVPFHYTAQLGAYYFE